MAAASLDVNFKEELGAIEQCQSTILANLIIIILTFSQGSRSSQKQSAQPLYTVFSNILPKFKFASSSPSSNKWPGQTQ